MKCRVSAARRPMHTAGAALLLLLLLLFLFISRNVWPISRLDAPQGTEARQREKQREYEEEEGGGGVGHRGLRPVSEIMSTLVATYARAGIATLWPVCTGNGSWRKAGRSGQGQGQGAGRCVASLFDSVCVAFKTEIICLLICRQAKGCARFVSFGFLPLSSTFILYCCLFLAGFFSIPVFLCVFCNSLLLCFLFLPLLRIYNSQCSTISAAVKVIAKISIAIDSKFNKLPFSTTLTPPPPPFFPIDRKNFNSTFYQIHFSVQSAAGLFQIMHRK